MAVPSTTRKYDCEVYDVFYGNNSTRNQKSTHRSGSEYETHEALSALYAYSYHIVHTYQGQTTVHRYLVRILTGTLYLVLNGTIYWYPGTLVSGFTSTPTTYSRTAVLALD